jgi:hypothetical membrane protein
MLLVSLLDGYGMSVTGSVRRFAKAAFGYGSGLTFLLVGSVLYRQGSTTAGTILVISGVVLALFGLYTEKAL